jgi:hypothetical protein
LVTNIRKKCQSLVYFELTEERDFYNKLIINPTPDSLLRVAIHVKKVARKDNIKEQQLSTFKRTGFTAVEWGVSRALKDSNYLFLYQCL